MKTQENHKDVQDAHLIAACLDGDGEAWEALLERYQRLIYSIPFRYGLSEPDAADIFQNVCILLLENLAGLRDRNKLVCWLVTVTRRECFRYQNNGSREMPVGEADEDESDPLDNIPDPGPSPDELCILWQQQHLLRNAVARLPERDRQLIHYLFYEPLSYEEIADRLNMPVASIGPTRGRVLKKLKRMVEALDSAKLLERPLDGAGFSAGGESTNDRRQQVAAG